MLFPILVVLAMGFTAGNVVTVKNPELFKFTQEKLDNYNPEGMENVRHSH